MDDQPDGPVGTDTGAGTGGRALTRRRIHSRSAPIQNALPLDRCDPQTQRVGPSLSPMQLRSITRGRLRRLLVVRTTFSLIIFFALQQRRKVFSVVCISMEWSSSMASTSRPIGFWHRALADRRYCRRLGGTGPDQAPNFSLDPAG